MTRAKELAIAFAIGSIIIMGFTLFGPKGPEGATSSPTGDAATLTPEIAYACTDPAGRGLIMVQNDPLGSLPILRQAERACDSAMLAARADGNDDCSTPMLLARRMAQVTADYLDGTSNDEAEVQLLLQQGPVLERMLSTCLDTMEI